MPKVKQIGIIAEDSSDFESSVVLIKRIAKRKNIPFKKAVGDGCGKIRKKAEAYAKNLFARGCDLLILIHDLDRNNLASLEQDLKLKLKNSPIVNKLVCIPVEEIEAWFISDPGSIQTVFSLERIPKFPGNPENVKSPKEKLGNEIYQCSNKTCTYLNTAHNKKLAEKVDLTILKAKCASFNKLHAFISKQRF
jgi:hypothetical protein